MTSGHILVVPSKIVKVEGPGRYGPKKSKRSWCEKKFGGHLYDSDRFYAALRSTYDETDIYATGNWYEPYWDFACEECAKRLGWLKEASR